MTVKSRSILAFYRSVREGRSLASLPGIPVLVPVWWRIRGIRSPRLRYSEFATTFNARTHAHHRSEFSTIKTMQSGETIYTTNTSEYCGLDPHRRNGTSHYRSTRMCIEEYATRTTMPQAVCIVATVPITLR